VKSLLFIFEVTREGEWGRGGLFIYLVPTYLHMFVRVILRWDSWWRLLLMTRIEFFCSRGP